VKVSVKRDDSGLELECIPTEEPELVD
jgi:hypothetical protein